MEEDFHNAHVASEVQRVFVIRRSSELFGYTLWQKAKPPFGVYGLKKISTGLFGGKGGGCLSGFTARFRAAQSVARKSRGTIFVWQTAGNSGTQSHGTKIGRPLDALSCQPVADSPQQTVGNSGTQSYGG